MQMKEMHCLCMDKAWHWWLVSAQLCSNKAPLLSWNKMFPLDEQSLMLQIWLWLYCGIQKGAGSCISCPSLSSSDVRVLVSHTICEVVITLPFHSTARRQHAGPGVLCEGAARSYTPQLQNVHNQQQCTQRRESRLLVMSFEDLERS